MFGSFGNSKIHSKQKQSKLERNVGHDLNFSFIYIHTQTSEWIRFGEQGNKGNCFGDWLEDEGENGELN